jgi:manganese transport protein
MSDWLKNSGPGALVAAAFIGPGTVTVCTIAGVRFGYELLWAMVLSTFATLVLQEMSARIGIVTQKGLAEVIRQQLTQPLVKGIVLTLIMAAIVIGNAAYEAGNISGGRLGLETLLAESNPGASRLLSLLIGAAAFVLLYIGSYKVLERALVSLVLLMSLAFVTTAIITRPDLSAVFKGMFFPSLSDASLLTVVGLIGTTVVPYNLFLHASLVKEKWKTEADLQHARRDTVIAVTLGGLVSIAIIISAASANTDAIASAADLARGLEPLFGSFARYFLSIGLFAAGITSAITAPLAAAYVANGCLGWDGNLKSWNFRIVWMLVLALGVIFSSLGISPIEIIQFAQIANGIALPIVVGIILWIMNRKAVLGSHVNSHVQNFFGLMIFAVTILLGIRAIILVFGL